MGYSGATRTFDTRADLRLQIGTPNVRVTLLGGAVISDGLGGDFYWDADSLAPEDNESIIQVVGIVTGRWIRMGVTP
jgi:hypothetical protein